MLTFNARLRHNEEEFVSQIQATYKLGIEFGNWGQLSDCHINLLACEQNKFTRTDTSQARGPLAVLRQRLGGAVRVGINFSALYTLDRSHCGLASAHSAPTPDWQRACLQQPLHGP